MRLRLTYEPQRRGGAENFCQIKPPRFRVSAARAQAKSRAVVVRLCLLVLSYDRPMSDHDAFAERGRALEEEYFRKKDRELIEKLRRASEAARRGVS